MDWTKGDGTTVARIGRVIEATMERDYLGFFVRASTARARYDGAYFASEREAIDQTPSLPQSVRNDLRDAFGICEHGARVRQVEGHGFACVDCAQAWGECSCGAKERC